MNCDIFCMLSTFQNFSFCINFIQYKLEFREFYDSEISRISVFISLPDILYLDFGFFSRFVPPQTSSGNRFMPQQNSPVPSPYAPQSPAGYMPYSHPSSYTTHPQMQQGKKVGWLFSGNVCNSKQIHFSFL